MRFKPFLMLTAFALLAVTAPAARAQEQQQDQKVIDDFVTTRGVSFDDPGKKSQPSSQSQAHHSNAGSAGSTHKNNTGGSVAKNTGASPAAGSASAKKGSSATSTQTASTKKDAAAGKGALTKGGAGDESAGVNAGGGAQPLKVSATTPTGLRPIGLGYTLFMKDKAGGMLVVDESHEFKSGDRLAIALETNTDGYLYVFNAEDGKNPVMLFPNYPLDKGANGLQAHVRETYPADLDYAFEFDEHPAIEHLFIVVSRMPLKGVPTGDELEELCPPKGDTCTEWKPTPAQWEQIKSVAPGKGVIEAKNTQLAQAKNEPVPQTTLSRGIKIKKDDPKPAVVRVNDSPDTSVLITEVELVHR
jgi:hypothetical protein